MRRGSVLSVLAVMTTLSAFATLAPAAEATSAEAAHDRQEESDAKFPMTAAEFRGRVNDRVEKARARMEEHIAAKQLPAEKAAEHRARFRAAVAQLNVKVDEVCADGTVTREEAVAVHELAKSLMHRHHAEA